MLVYISLFKQSAWKKQKKKIADLRNLTHS